MKLKQFLSEIKRPDVTIKLKKVKNPETRLISYEIDKWKIDPTMSKFKSDSKGKAKPTYQIWNGNMKVPQYLPYEYTTLKKAKEALQSMINRQNKLSVAVI